MVGVMSGRHRVQRIVDGAPLASQLAPPPAPPAGRLVLDRCPECNGARRPIAGRRFVLDRSADVSGVSGVGMVATGVEFPDGTVAIQWAGAHPSTVVWRTMADAMAVHGHGGATRAVWLD